jgi:predicted NAD/FAD-dependent oxidoreductase
MSSATASTHIAVIGAGIAGTACASALQRAGYQVSLFDKSRGPGGRMSTRRGEDWQCDHGAQYFTARAPAFRAEVARWEAAGVAAQWHAQVSSFGTRRRCRRRRQRRRD